MDIHAIHAQHLTGTPVSQLAKAHKVSPSSIYSHFRKMGLALECDNRSDAVKRVRPSLVGEFDDTAFVEFKSLWNKLDSKVKGTITEGNVKNKLMELGFEVWAPCMNNHKADLGVIANGRLLRIQVKTATYDPTTKRFRAMLMTRDKYGNHIKYAGKEVDFFIVQCAGLQEFYVIPGAVGIKDHNANVFPHRSTYDTRNRQKWEQYRNAFSLLGG